MSIKNRSSISHRVQKPSITKRNLAKVSNQRVRNPITRSRMTIRGQFPSKKMQCMVAWESQLERRACYLFEFSSEVHSFREQPCTLVLPFEDRIRRYTPDFEVVWSTGEVSYFEIKPFNKIDQLKEYFCAISLFLEARGICFALLTDLELINSVREHNLLLLRAHQNYMLDQKIIDAFREIPVDRSSFLFGELVEYFESSSVVYALISQNFLFVDLNKSLLQNSLILINQKKDIPDETNLFTYRVAPNFR